MSDPLPAAVFTDLVAELVARVATWSIRSAARIGPTSGEDPPVQAEVLAKTLDRSLASLTQPEEIDSALGGERFRAFLESPDLFNLLQRLFLTKLSGQDDPADQIREEFLLSWALWVGMAAETLRPHLDRIFNSLATPIAVVALDVRESGLTTPSDRRGFQIALLSHQLDSINQRLAFLAKPHSVADFHKFESDYRRQVGERHSRITPPHIDDARRVTLESIYVEPAFHAIQKNQHGQRLSLDDVRGSLGRTVVLGAPGAGKSTFTIKLCSDLATQYSSGLVGGLPLTPVLVFLREYGVAKAERQQSILDFISDSASSDYQLPPPPGVLEYMMVQGRALVIFDGLDELVDPGRRRVIRDDIESFCSRFPAVRVLVTAREIGYEQAPLDPDVFDLVRLAEFDNDQVNDYVHKWFAAHPDVTAVERSRQIEAFLRESAAVVSDLRQNPLLLALMCNIYKGEGYIPTNRPEVYAQCSNMLLRRWDSSRGIQVSRPLGAHLERTLQYLAHWIFENAGLQGGVPERQLLDVATRYLAEKRFEDEDEARIEAGKFLEFCKGRAWVLVEVGTTDQQPLFQFAHRTFLEYFTADYLVRNSENARALGRKLRTMMGQAAWDVIAQLAVQLQQSYKEDAGDVLLEMTLGFAETGSSRGRIRYLSFSLRALEFLVPRPTVTRRIALQAFESILAELTQRVAKPVPLTRHRELFGNPVDQLSQDLLSVSDENLRTVWRVVEERSKTALAGSKPDEAIAAGHWLLMASVGSHGRSGRASAAPLASATVLDQLPRLHELADISPRIARQLIFHHGYSVATALDRFGPSLIFSGDLDYGGPWFRPSWTDLALYRLMSTNLSETWPDAESDLGDIGVRLLASALPWVPGRWATRGFGLIGLHEDSHLDEEWDWSPDATFGAFCLLLPRMQQRGNHQRMIGVVTGQQGTLAQLVRLSGGRIGDAPDSMTVMDSLGWDTSMQRFARGWLSRRISVVGRQAALTGTAQIVAQ